MKVAVSIVALAGALMALALAADMGSRADVAAVRAAVARQYPGERLLGVHVVGNYGLVDWYDAHSSGYGLFKRAAAGRWSRVDWGGGAMPASLMAQQDHVPLATAHQLCSGWGSSSPC